MNNQNIINIQVGKNKIFSCLIYKNMKYYNYILFDHFDHLEIATSIT